MCFIEIQVNWPFKVGSCSTQKVLIEGTVREFNLVSIFLTMCENFSSCLKDMWLVAIAPRSNHWCSGIVKEQNDSASAQLEWTGRRMSGMCEVCSHRINWLLWSHREDKQVTKSYEKCAAEQKNYTTARSHKCSACSLLLNKWFSVWRMTPLCHHTRAAL